MPEFFMTMMMFVCADFTGPEKAICVRDMLACKARVEHSRPNNTKEELIRECVGVTYLNYFNTTKRQATSAEPGVRHRNGSNP